MNHSIIDKDSLSDKQISDIEEKLRYVEPLSSYYITPPEKRKLREEACRLQDITERTLRKWVSGYRHRGVAALIRKERVDCGQPRVVNDLIVKKSIDLLRENPYRSVRHVLILLKKDREVSSSLTQNLKPATLYHHIKKTGFSFKQSRNPKSGRVFRKFEAQYVNQLWQGDARHGIPLPHPEQKGRARMTYLYAWIDDYSRKILYAKYFWDEKLPRLEESLRQAILSWGIPEKLYCDNGATYASRHFTLIVNNIGTRKIHHPPYRAWCKGKVERVMGRLIVFQEEAKIAGIQTLEELNNTLWAWMDVEYNQKYHSSIGQTPEERYKQSVITHAPRRVTSLETFDSYFLWQDERVVTKYGYISLNKNQYRLKEVGVGEKVTVKYNPYDLQEVYVYHNRKYVGAVKAYRLFSQEHQIVPEENTASASKVSQSARRYFDNIREEHQQNIQNQDVSFSNIINRSSE